MKRKICMKKKFVKTKDPKTAELLEREGFTLVSHEGDTYTFLNDGKENFQAKDKAVFTNILNV